MMSLVAIAIESYFKGTTRPYYQILPLVLLPAMFLNYCVFKIIQGSDSLLTGFILISVMNLGLRVMVTIFWFKQWPTKGVFVSLILMIAAKLVTKLF